MIVFCQSLLYPQFFFIKSLAIGFSIVRKFSVDKIYRTLWPDHFPVPDLSYRITFAMVSWSASLTNFASIIITVQNAAKK